MIEIFQPELHPKNGILGHSNWMANVGGAITSHPMGTSAGVKAMIQAISKSYGKEYYSAIEKWGYKNL